MSITIAGCDNGAVVKISTIESDTEQHKTVIVLEVTRGTGSASIRTISVPGNVPRYHMVAVTSGVTRWVNYQGVFVHRA